MPVEKERNTETQESIPTAKDTTTTGQRRVTIGGQTSQLSNSNGLGDSLSLPSGHEQQQRKQQRLITWEEIKEESLKYNMNEEASVLGHGAFGKGMAFLSF